MMHPPWNWWPQDSVVQAAPQVALASRGWRQIGQSIEGGSAPLGASAEASAGEVSGCSGDAAEAAGVADDPAGLRPAGDPTLRGEPSAEEARAAAGAAGAEEQWVAAAVGRKNESIFVREAVSAVFRVARSRCFRFFSPAAPLPHASSSSESSSSSAAASCSYSDSAQDTHIRESGRAITTSSRGAAAAAPGSSGRSFGCTWFSLARLLPRLLFLRAGITCTRACGTSTGTGPGEQQAIH